MSTEPQVVTWLARQVADDQAELTITAETPQYDAWTQQAARRLLADCAAKQKVIDGYRLVHEATQKHAEEFARDFHRSARGHGPDPRLDGARMQRSHYLSGQSAALLGVIYELTQSYAGRDGFERRWSSVFPDMPADPGVR